MQNKQRHGCRERMCGHQGGWSGVNWETGVDAVDTTGKIDEQ